MLNRTINSFKEEYEDLSTDDRFLDDHSNPHLINSNSSFYHGPDKYFLNEKIRKIKDKYGLGVSRLTEHDKQNLPSQINLSESDAMKSGKSARKLAIKNGNKQRIQDLEQINNKISQIIKDMKKEEESNVEISHLVPDKQERIFNGSIERHYFIGRKTNQISYESKRKSGSLTKIQPTPINNDKNKSLISHSRSKEQKIKKQSAPHASYIQSKFKFKSKSPVRKTGQISKTAISVTNLSQFSTSQHSIHRKNDKLIKRLCKQIKLDEIHVEAKTVFRKQPQSKQKQIIDVLVKKQGGFNFEARDKVRRMIQLDSDQLDPEFTERNNKHENSLNKLQMKSIADKLIQTQTNCEKMWQNKLYKQFSRSDLDLSMLDMENKGYILKEDLTRFVSMHSHRFLCNRSIALIFKRIKKRNSERVYPHELIECFCSCS